MLVFPSMIEEAARQAGMKVPDDTESDFNAEEFPHFHVYCNAQLGCPITWGNHWHNAEIIAKIPEDKLKEITEQDLFYLGFDP